MDYKFLVDMMPGDINKELNRTFSVTKVKGDYDKKIHKLIAPHYCFKGTTTEVRYFIFLNDNDYLNFKIDIIQFK